MGFSILLAAGLLIDSPTFATAQGSADKLAVRASNTVLGHTTNQR